MRDGVWEYTLDGKPLYVVGNMYVRKQFPIMRLFPWKLSLKRIMVSFV